MEADAAADANAEPGALRGPERVVDIYAVNLSELLEGQKEAMHGDEVDTSIMLYIAPHLVRMELAEDFAMPSGTRPYRPGSSHRAPEGFPGSIGFPSLASAQKGERLYTFILGQVRRCLDSC